MYYCKNCQKEFENPKSITETHGLNNSPFEIFYVCPNCNSTSIYERILTHCQCCGAKLINGQNKYCSNECKIKGDILWNKQFNNINNSISKLVERIEKFNKDNNLKLSYGQYVSLLYQRDAKFKYGKRKKELSKQVQNSRSKNKKT